MRGCISSDSDSRERKLTYDHSATDGGQAAPRFDDAVYDNAGGAAGGSGYGELPAGSFSRGRFIADSAFLLLITTTPICQLPPLSSLPTSFAWSPSIGLPQPVPSTRMASTASTTTCSSRPRATWTRLAGKEQAVMHRFAFSCHQTHLDLLPNTGPGRLRPGPRPALGDLVSRPGVSGVRRKPGVSGTLISNAPRPNSFRATPPTACCMPTASSLCARASSRPASTCCQPCRM